MSNNADFWRAKIAAFIHDPASKALILMRGRGHEEGSVKELKKTIFGGAFNPFEEKVKKADHWASAADRLPLPKELRTKIVFTSKPELIHALSGEALELSFYGIELPPSQIEKLNFEHFAKSIIRNDNEEIDWQKTFLAFWRFGIVPPEDETGEIDLGVLWQELPADTRSPDHSIWDHISLTSAFAGAMPDPALLLMSFGPVQGFIAQARSVSDLWAGSHLLSMMAWEGMKVVCEEYGPDSIIFPQLRGVPVVDVWLKEEKQLPWPQKVPYPDASNDTDPLFVAALPNRFLALVPAEKAEDIAGKVKKNVKNWISKNMQKVLEKLELHGSQHYAKEQVERQMENFPEVNWAVVPWKLASVDGNGNLDDTALRDALERMGYNEDYLGPRAQLRQNQKTEFYRPNPGIAYPGLFELVERVHASAKSIRPFGRSQEEGYRCTICGEREWLTEDKKQLNQSPGNRTTSIWQEKAGKFGIKEGEHLCAWCALKRLWPDLFGEWLEEKLPSKPARYVLSTSSMALSSSLWNATLTRKLQSNKQELCKKVDKEAITATAALPLKLYRRLDDNVKTLARKLPFLLEQAQEEEEAELSDKEKQLADLLGTKPEKYYGLILMDGDRMGKWLAADPSIVPAIGQRFHEEVRKELESMGLKWYLKLPRLASPAWHQAISGALNSFSVALARVVVEELFMGKLIYAGGDDLLAMVALHDLPGLMLALRKLYSGSGMEPSDWQWLTNGTMPNHLSLKLGKGFAVLEKQVKVNGSADRRKLLYRLMGEEATASLGAVVAHHKTPLARVLNELRGAEKRAKTTGGRDAFCMVLMKRSGGQTSFLGKWLLQEKDLKEGDMGLLIRTRDFLAAPGVSRRAAYILIEALRDLPAEKTLLRDVMRHHFFRQGAEAVKNQNTAEKAEKLAEALAERASSQPLGVPGTSCPVPTEWLRSLFITAEFLAREGRSPRPSNDNS